MKTWRRATLYLVRKKGRSVLLVVLIFAMASLILSGNALKTSTDREIEKIRKNLGSSFIVEADTENETLYEERFDRSYPYKAFVGRKLSSQLIEEIMSVEGVMDCEINDFELTWTNLELRPGLWADTSEGQYITEEEVLVRRQSTVAIICGNGDTNVNFRTGAFSIIDGRNILNGDEFTAVVSEYVAEKNHLAVGDSIIFETKRGIFEPCEVPSERWGVPVELKVVGIFAPNFEQEASVFTAEEEYADNFIFIDRAAGLQLKKNIDSLMKKINIEADQIQETYGEATFFVEDPATLEDIMSRVKDTVDLSGLLVSQDDSAYRASVKPLKQIGMFSAILMYSGLFGCIIILYLILTLWIKGRKNEIGILLSIGIGKVRIVFQFILEAIIITAISLTLTTASAQAITDSFLGIAEKISEPESGETTYSVNVKYGETVPTITKISSDEVELEYRNSERDILYLIVIVNTISCISVLLASIQIMKLSPRKLLQLN